MIGTTKKIICATDMVRAICRPDDPSRTIATASTRVDADISPCSSRATSNVGSDQASAQASDPSVNRISPPR